MERRKFMIGCGVLLAAAAGAGWTSAQGATVPPEIPRNNAAPLVEPTWRDGPRGLWGTLSIATNQREAHLYWRASSPRAAGVETCSRVFELPFEPTAAAGSSRFGEAYVAGVTSRGYTTIQRIRFGGPTFKSLPTRIDQIDEVYFEDLAGEQIVLSMVVDRTNPDRVYIQFWNSPRLYSLDTTSGCITTIATATDDGDPGTRTIEALAYNHNTMYSRVHETHGFVYWVVQHGPGEGPTILLIDSDRDGSLDAHHSSSVATGFDSLGLSSGYAD